MTELQCRLCHEKFSGQNHLLTALFHLKQVHPRELEKNRKKKRLVEEGKDLCSPVVTSTRSFVDVQATVSSYTQTCDNERAKGLAVCKPAESTTHEVPGKMKVYFSLTESEKPYKCHICGNYCSNLKMCVVHLLRKHDIALKSNSTSNQSIQTGNKETTTNNMMKLRQTARKSISTSSDHQDDSVESISYTLNDGGNATKLSKSSKCSKRSLLKRKAKKTRIEGKKYQYHWSQSKYSYKSYRKRNNSSKLSKEERDKRKNRIRIMKIKIALFRQRRTRRVVLDDAFENISPEALSPENCFEEISSCSDLETSAGDLCILESPVRSMRDNEYGNNAGSQVSTSSDIVSSSVSQDALSNGNDRDDQVSCNSMDKHFIPGHVGSPLAFCPASSTTKNAESVSVWNGIVWNSTHDLASNKVTSSGIPLPKKSISADNCPSPSTVSENVLPCMTAIHVAASQQSTAMLKQLKSRTIKPSNRVSDGNSHSSHNMELPKKISRSQSVPYGPQCNPECPKEEITACSSDRKKTARKTTRPSTAKKVSKHRASDSYLTYLDNNSFGFSVQVSKSPSHKPLDDKLLSSSSITQQGYLNYIESLTNDSENEITSSSQGGSSVELNSPHDQSSHLARLSVQENRSRKPTGRKSVHSDYVL